MRALLIALSFVVGLGSAVAVAQPGDAEPRPARQREVLRERTSGFWTSNQPAKNGAYRWRLLGIGVGLVAITGFVMLRVVRKASRERAAKQVPVIAPRA